LAGTPSTLRRFALSSPAAPSTMRNRASQPRLTRSSSMLAPSLALWPPSPALDREQHVLPFGAHAKHTTAISAFALAVEPHAHHCAVKNARTIGSSPAAAFHAFPVALHLAPWSAHRVLCPPQPPNSARERATNAARVVTRGSCPRINRVGRHRAAAGRLRNPCSHSAACLPGCSAGARRRSRRGPKVPRRRARPVPGGGRWRSLLAGLLARFRGATAFHTRPHSAAASSSPS